MSERLDKQVDGFLRRVGWLRVAHRALWLSVGWLFAWGATVLVLRYGFNLPQLDMLWGALGLPFILLAAWLLEWRNRPDREAVKAFLDQHNDCGGLLMAEAAAWRHRMPKVQAPELAWRNRGPLAALVLAGLFLVLALALPRSVVAPVFAQQRLAVDDQAEVLLEQIEELEQLDQLPDEEAEELREQLEQIREEADGTDPVSTWSALDQLEDLLNEESGQAATNLTARLEKLEDAEKLAEALEQLDERALSPETLTEAMKQLGEMMQDKQMENLLSQLGQEDEQLKEALEKMAAGMDPEDLKQLAETLGNNPDVRKQLEDLGRGLNQEQLQQLGEALRNNREALQEQLREMAQRGAIDPQMLEEALGNAAGAGEGAGEDLQEWLERELAGRDPAAGELMQGGMAPWDGQGQIQRGPGHAPLDFRHQSDREGTAFQPKVLPPSAIAAIRESRLLGLSEATPSVTEGVDGAAGALGGARSGAGSSHAHRIQPRHKGTVANYFDR